MSNPYRMTDNGYGVASFKSGGAFLFDEIDLPLIERHTWHLGKRGYPATHYHGRTVVFHRLLFPDADGEVDHINGDKMDNRRCNLRICTHQQNAFNQKRRSTNTSGFIGVSPVKDAPFYEAYIHLHGRKHHLGTFSDPKQAARTRDAVARLVFGEYARLNYPKGSRRQTTLRELEQKKEYVRNHYIEGQLLREDMPFYQYAEEWYRLKKEPFISDASRSAYRTMFNKHILPAFGLRHLRAISASELQNFINSFADSSKSQITLAVGTLKALFASAYAEGIIERDPSVSIIRPKAKKKTERRALTEQETENVLHTIQSHEHGLFLAVLYYLGLRRGEALGLQWGDFDFDEDLVHIQRDIDYVGSTAHDGALKTAAANRYIPVPQELRAMLSKVRGFPQQYVFHTEEGHPWPQSSFKRIWLSLMEASCCVEEREVTKATKRKNDIIKQLKPTLTPHYFRHNYATLLFETGVEPLIAMKISSDACFV